MSFQPRLLIADEPTTALDVTIQKQVLLLLNRLKQDMKTGILFITHDLGVVAQIADRVIVLYSGSKVEEGATRQIFENPLHPYTNGLIAAVPNVDSDEFEIRPIPGTFPSITEEIGGCRFHPRCPYATERCRQEVPQALEYGARPLRGLSQGRGGKQVSDQKQVLLELNKLKKYFPVRKGVNLKAVEDISLKIYEGEKFGVVGESGCGKSTLGRVILQLYPQTSGACVYYGKSLEEVSPAYVAKEIAHLTQYQQKAKEFYQKSLEVDRKVAELNTPGDGCPLRPGHRPGRSRHDWPALQGDRLSELEYRSQELRKDASRQLREGSRTAGSLILCREHRPRSRQLFQQGAGMFD